MILRTMVTFDDYISVDRIHPTFSMYVAGEAEEHMTSRLRSLVFVDEICISLTTLYNVISSEIPLYEAGW